MSARYRINNRDYYTLGEITEHFSITSEQAISRFVSENRLWSTWVDREHVFEKEQQRHKSVAKYRKMPVKTLENTVTDPRPVTSRWTTYDAKDRRAARKAAKPMISGAKRFNHKTMAVRVDNRTFANKEAAAQYLDITLNTLMARIRQGLNARIKVIDKVNGNVLDLTVD